MANVQKFVYTIEGVKTNTPTKIKSLKSCKLNTCIEFWIICLFNFKPSQLLHIKIQIRHVSVRWTPLSIVNKNYFETFKIYTLFLQLEYITLLNDVGP